MREEMNPERGNVMLREGKDVMDAGLRGLLIMVCVAALALFVGGTPAVEQGTQEKDSTTFGPRIPTKFFRTGGTGTSWQGIPPDPYETFSYDVALLQAGIEDFNVVPYTSVLPEACRNTEVSIKDVDIIPGSVLEVIMSKVGDQVDGLQSTHKTLVTGVGIVWAAKSSTPGKIRNGYAAEYEFSHITPVSDEEARQDALAQLNKSLDHELKIRGLVQLESSERQYQIDVLQLVYEEGKVQYGTCLSALGFVEFDFPTLVSGGSGGGPPGR
jgi:arginine decarboxylase